MFKNIPPLEIGEMMQAAKLGAAHGAAISIVLTGLYLCFMYRLRCHTFKAMSRQLLSSILSFVPVAMLIAICVAVTGYNHSVSLVLAAMVCYIEVVWFDIIWPRIRYAVRVRNTQHVLVA